MFSQGRFVGCKQGAEIDTDSFFSSNEGDLVVLSGFI